MKRHLLSLLLVCAMTVGNSPSAGQPILSDAVPHGAETSVDRITYKLYWRIHHGGGDEERTFVADKNGTFHDGERTLTAEQVDALCSLILSSQEHQKLKLEDMGLSKSELENSDYCLKELSKRDTLFDDPIFNDPAFDNPLFDELKHPPDFSEAPRILKRFDVKLSETDVFNMVKDWLDGPGLAPDKHGVSITIKRGRNNIRLTSSGHTMYLPWEIEANGAKWVSYWPKLNEVGAQLSKDYSDFFTHKVDFTESLTIGALTCAEDKLTARCDEVIRATGNAENLLKHYTLKLISLFPSSPTHFCFYAEPKDPTSYPVDRYEWQVLSKNGMPVATFAVFEKELDDWNRVVQSIKWLKEWKTAKGQREIVAEIQTGHEPYAFPILAKKWQNAGLKGTPEKVIQLLENDNPGSNTVLLASHSESRLLLCQNSNYYSWRQNCELSSDYGDFIVVGADSLPEQLRQSD